MHFAYHVSMTTLNHAHFKKVLADEQQLLKRQLESVGRINPENHNDWEPAMNRESTETAELESRASDITEFEDRSAVEFALEERYNEITAALVRIDEGAYGTCIVCNKTIEEERLNANPAARTCKAHRDSASPSTVMV